MTRKSPGRPFPKGVSANPGGRPPLAPELKAFKQTTYEDFLKQLQTYGGMSEEELEDDLRRPDITMFEKLFGNLVKGAAKGEKDARRVLLERLWGKPKVDVDLNLNVRNMPTSELITMAAQLLADIESNADAIEAEYDDTTN